MSADGAAPVRVGVVTFPGSLDDRDALRALRRCGEGFVPVPLWYADEDLAGVDAVVLPGGFTYGDYLRVGALAARAPIMRAVAGFAADGGPVLGICNGFQVLCEARLLPGALLRNAGLRFVCRPVRVQVEGGSDWTAGLPPGTQLTLPAKHGEGRYHADRETLDRLEADGRVLARYVPGDNPNGSVGDIAGVVNEAGNVVGLMPHPEHAVDPQLAGGTDGRRVFRALAAHLRAAMPG